MNKNEGLIELMFKTYRPAGFHLVQLYKYIFSNIYSFVTLEYIPLIVLSISIKYV
jgi:hypothetical protein